MGSSTTEAEKNVGGATEEHVEDGYTIRPFEPGDRDDFLSLYESVWGARRTEDWFDWKYGTDNPFFDEIPVLVAESGGDLVGAKPHVPIRLRAGDATPLGLIGTDTMVHEDHRRQGLFSRLTDQAVERYADREPLVTFNYPNENSRRGYRKSGWYFLGNRNANAYRIHDPKPFVRQFGGTESVVTAPVADVLARGAYSLLDRLRESADDVTVEKDPADSLAELGAVARRTGEPKLHVERDETFYRWWLEESESEMVDGDEEHGSDEEHGDEEDDEEERLAERNVYVAYRGDEPVAGAVAVTYALTEPLFGEYFEYDSVTDVLEVTPVASEDRSGAVVGVLERVLSDSRDSRYVTVPENALSSDLLRSFGFLGQTHPQISSVAELPGPLAVRPLGEEFTADGVTVTDPDNWLVTNAEYR